MKLYSVSVYWHRKGERRDHVKTAIILAKSEKEAKARFEAEVNYPEDHIHISVSECKDGIYTMAERRTL